MSKKNKQHSVFEKKYEHSNSPCPDKEVCGSCGWSHIPYDAQLTQKLSDINGSFALKELSVRCETIHPSPRTSHYRNRMDFVIDFEGRVGLRQKGKWWKVIDDHCCFISDERIEAGFHRVRDWVRSAGLSYFDRKKHVGFLRYAVIRCTLAGDLLLTLVTSTAGEAEKSQFLAAAEELIADELFGSIVWSINPTPSDVSFGEELSTLKGEGYLREEINGWKFDISPHSFFQTNSHGASVLHDKVIEFASRCSATKALDLYCGSGFFTFGLRKAVGEVLGVEISDEAVAAAQRNAEINEIHDIEFHAAKTEDFEWESFGADLILVDPPRAGMHDRALKRLLEYAPKHLLYVSCNYKHLARESCEILEKYELKAIEAIDMFPHTPHVEVVSLFKRKD